MVQDIREIADGLRNIRCCRKKCQVFEILKSDNLEGIVRDLEPATVCKLLELLQMEKSTKAKTRPCKKASGASYGRNLVKNPSGELGFEHWTIKGHGMVVEEEPFGFGEYAQECKKFPRSFTSSFGWSSKTTQIDLVKEGFTRTDLDHVQPEIRVSEWFVGRLDCGSKYKFTARLLGEDQEILDQFHFENHWPGWTRPE
ncbi:hypothetical protein L596_017616 [Steinernema carpocapsae]|uniref:FBA domain-containing protein n=1 Tax=Steinernema carpocapsae TaxID=34508 RepID=A0A4U5N2I3_STECR|nr:hypothetical protein L596_017616 [Steinernema carpocapsae]